MLNYDLVNIKSVASVTTGVSWNVQTRAELKSI